MGAGASSGAGSAPSGVRRGDGGSSVTNSDRNNESNRSSGTYIGTEQASKASVSSDYPSPKHAKHVVINAAGPKKPQGTLIDKLLQRTSLSNSPGQMSPSSGAGSGNGSVAGSEKSQRSTRVGRRDEYDVDSDDEDLGGFIYDDDSTSEDEREDYVNAFSRRRKQPGEDYSDYEGAAVRALTAGQLKNHGVRRTRSSLTDDGDDEWDPEEERIRQLRQQKKNEDRAKAAALASKRAAAGAGPAKSVADDGRAGPGPPAMTASQQGGASSPRPQPPQPPRLVPQPPLEPPVRGNSGNMRRNAAGPIPGGVNGGGPSGLAPGPGPSAGLGPGPGPTAGARAGPDGCAAAAKGTRANPAPPPQVNYGASASSQYWQAKRAQDDNVGAHVEGAGQGLSRLEQLAALQKKKQAQAQEQVGRPGAEQANHQANAGRTEPSGGGGRKLVSTEAPDPGRSDAAAAQTATAPHPHQEQRAPLPPPQQQQEPVVVLPGDLRESGNQGPAPRRQLDGQSFIKHLEPPASRRQVSKTKSGKGQAAAARTNLVSRPPALPRDSDEADFDVDEVLNSFSPTICAVPMQQQQEPQLWAGSRPQPLPGTQPAKDACVSSGHAPQQKRSIRSVQSEFTSMRINDLCDGAMDLTGRVLSLPLPTSRVSGAGAAGPQTSLKGTQQTVTSAAVTVSRFARMGATMACQPGTQEGSGMTTASGPTAGGTGHRAAGVGSGITASAPSAISGGGSQVTPSPPRRPRRSTASSDGTAPPIHSSLSAPPVDGPPTAGQSRTSVPHAVNHTHNPISGFPAGDTALLRPGHRPGSSSAGGAVGRGTDVGGGTILNGVGRSRFGAAQHQQFQQEVARNSVPAGHAQRDYDSDSALNRTTGAARYSYNGAVRGAAGVSGSILQVSGLDTGVAVLGATARRRLGQVGA